MLQVRSHFVWEHGCLTSRKTSGRPCRNLGQGIPREKPRLSGASKKTLSRHAKTGGASTRQLTVKPQLPLSSSHSDELIPGERPNTTENIWLDSQSVGAKALSSSCCSLQVRGKDPRELQTHTGVSCSACWMLSPAFSSSPNSTGAHFQEQVP